MRVRISPWSLALLLIAGTAAGCAHAGPAHDNPPATLDDLSGDALFTRGKTLAEQGEYIAAEQYFVAARRRGYPEKVAVRELVAVCLASHRIDSALTHALPYLERNAEDLSMRQVVAAMHLAMGQHDAAREALSEILAEAPERPEAQFLMAVVMRDGYGDQDGARSHFESYLAVAPAGEHASEARAFLRKHTRMRQVDVEAREEVQ